MRRRLLSASVRGGRTAAAYQRAAAAYPRTPCGHPLIDVSPLLHGGDATLTVKHLRAALEQFGYFYAANVDVLPESYIRSIYDYAQRCHALPSAIKEKYKQRGGTGVYSGPDIGQVELQYEANGPPATVRGWDYSRVRFTLAADSTQASHRYDVHSDPRYPTASELYPPFAPTLDELYARQNVLAVALLAGFERALELAPRTLRDMFDQGEGDFGTIRLLHYPGDATAAASSTGIGAHTDFECFTLMHQDAHGLQLMPRRPGGGHGDWIDAPVRKAEFIVIVGDMLERLTNGTLLATPHRVLPTLHKRSSIIRFNAFAPETLIEPLPRFVTAGSPRAYSSGMMPVDGPQSSFVALKLNSDLMVPLIIASDDLCWPLMASDDL